MLSGLNGLANVQLAEQLGVNPGQSDVGPGRTALAAVASEPAAVDAVVPAPAGSRSVKWTGLLWLRHG
ncbi:Hypothetical protein SMAX5B_004999 [Scophthalmus maximus]|uniref:Uncharacterized protein n=1 Tax=Scophthalmus maximus TaxID=52904 RepID=A0A2U9AZM6_SCOMX|nr:Hypothetical protein SMAX5B_004999 [Scophthalmus maximus]